MNPNDITDRVRTLQRAIGEACARSGRRHEDVTLVAVSKRKPVSLIRAAYEAGLRDFGENYAQELRDKAGELSDLPDLRWHFIGPLQRNKAQYVVGRASLIHSVDNVALIDRIEQLAARQEHVQDVLVQLNLSGEQSKSGAPAKELDTLLAAMAQRSHVRCVGLMTMPAFTEDPQPAAPVFRGLCDLQQGQLANRKEVTHLSMGMSHDFAVAISHGATMIRVGSLIFGARD